MIKLNVKSPTSVEDKIIEANIEGSVKDVKCQIEKEWPFHPSPKDQRLVYAGKLLEDSSILQEVLRLDDARDENNAFTIHLVCRMSAQPSSQNSTTHSEQPQVRKRHNNSPSATSNEVGASGSSSSTLTNSASSTFRTPFNTPDSQQAAIMQQMYANYMTQYVQYLQSIGAMNAWPGSASQSLVDHTNQAAEEARAAGQAAPGVLDPLAAAAVAGAVANNLQQHPQAPLAIPQADHPVNNNQIPVENNINAAPGAAAGAPDGPNVVLNAGAGGIGAMEDDDELNGGGQRDILDWCYVVTRVLVLFSVVYFYSSLARFALAAGLGIIFYLYNNGFFGHQPQRQGQRAPNQQHDEAVNEVRQVAGAAGGDPPPRGQDGDQDPAANEDANEASNPGNDHQINSPPPPHPLTVLSTFVTTFFTSLLPNDPQIA